MQKKIACINDISGIGKCSLTVALPIISALKCQCCPLTTSVLSSQTGYPKYTFSDLTNSMEDYIQVWQDLSIEFDTIYSGFLGSCRQIKIVEKFINMNKDAFVIVDPVLADLGSIFPIFNHDDVNEMKKLVSIADLITPNITEANLLTSRKPDFFEYNDDSLVDLCKSLSKIGPKYVIITGFEQDGKIFNICYDSNLDSISKVGTEYNKISFSGTGDTFTSIVAGMITRGFSIEDSVKCATNFIYEAVNFTVKQENFDRNDGILFEYFLDKLTNI